MVQIVNRRNLDIPTVRKLRWELLSLQQTIFIPVGAYVTERFITVRKHFITRTGSRKKTLLLGALLPTSTRNRNVLLYRKLQPNPTQFYPVFTPWKRRLQALGNKVAPVIVVGTGGSGMDLQHALGLSLMKLGGVRF